MTHEWKMIVTGYRNQDKQEENIQSDGTMDGTTVVLSRGLFMETTGPFPGSIVNRKIVRRIVRVILEDEDYPKGQGTDTSNIPTIEVDFNAGTETGAYRLMLPYSLRALAEHRVQLGGRVWLDGGEDADPVLAILRADSKYGLVGMPVETAG